MVLPNVTPSELARGTGTILQEVNRILDIDHLTKIDRIAQALGALATDWTGRSADQSIQPFISA
jgi:hypothetical protein